MLRVRALKDKGAVGEEELSIAVQKNIRRNAWLQSPCSLWYTSVYLQRGTLTVIKLDSVNSLMAREDGDQW